MALDLTKAIIITGGKLIRNESSNSQNSLSFQKIKDNSGKVYLEVNAKILVAETDIINAVRTLEGFKGEDEITTTKNLVILDTEKKSDEKGNTFYVLPIQDAVININFDKNNVGQIGISISAEGISKTDHGGDSNKTDHSYIPF